MSTFVPIVRPPVRGRTPSPISSRSLSFSSQETRDPESWQDYEHVLFPSRHNSDHDNQSVAASDDSFISEESLVNTSYTLFPSHDGNGFFLPPTGSTDSLILSPTSTDASLEASSYINISPTASHGSPGPLSINLLTSSALNSLSESGATTATLRPPTQSRSRREDDVSPLALSAGLGTVFTGHVRSQSHVRRSSRSSTSSRSRGRFSRRPQYQRSTSRAPRITDSINLPFPWLVEQIVPVSTLELLAERPETSSIELENDKTPTQSRSSSPTRKLARLGLSGRGKEKQTSTRSSLGLEFFVSPSMYDSSEETETEEGMVTIRHTTPQPKDTPSSMTLFYPPSPTTSQSTMSLSKLAHLECIEDHYPTWFGAWDGFATDRLRKSRVAARVREQSRIRNALAEEKRCASLPSLFALSPTSAQSEEAESIPNWRRPNRSLHNSTEMGQSAISDVSIVDDAPWPGDDDLGPWWKVFWEFRVKKSTS